VLALEDCLVIEDIEDVELLESVEPAAATEVGLAAGWGIVARCDNGFDMSMTFVDCTTAEV
jgi:hypothetical protein